MKQEVNKIAHLENMVKDGEHEKTVSNKSENKSEIIKGPKMIN